MGRKKRMAMQTPSSPQREHLPRGRAIITGAISHAHWGLSSEPQHSHREEFSKPEAFRQAPEPASTSLCKGPSEEHPLSEAVRPRKAIPWTSSREAALILQGGKPCPRPPTANVGNLYCRKSFQRAHLSLS